LFKKIVYFLLICFISAGLPSALFSQEQTGSLKGLVLDKEGSPLPGVSITISSPAMMGTLSFVTAANGSFRFPSLPPGTYTLKAEMAGFKPLTRENIIVRVGMTVTLDLNMEVAALQEQITVTAASPVVDVQSTKVTVVMDRELLKNIPMARDLYDIVNSAPGAVSEGMTYRRTSSILGGTVRGNTYAFDGVNMNDPVVMYPLTNINFDVMEEVEMIMSGHPASVGYTDGAYINVVTRSGGNKLSGGAVLYYTNKDMAQHLWTDEQVKAMNIAKPNVDKSSYDGSLTLGGPVMKDRIWFFTNARMNRREQVTNFIGPWTDILGRTHNPYNWTHKEKMGFIKLTSQLTTKLKLMGMFNLVDMYRPMYEEPGPRQPFISTRVWDHEKGITVNGQLNYVLGQNTFLDLRVGYVHRYFPIPLQPAARDLPWVDDAGDVYGVLTTARFNETYLRKRFQTGLYFTHFMDNFLGGNHEIKGGVELENAYGDWDWWRKDNALIRYDSRNPNWNFYTTYGRVDFYICGPDEGSTKIIDKAQRIGGYIQDSFTYANRLTLNIGLRFDYSTGMKPAISKKAGGNPLSVYIGENYVRPYVAANYPTSFPNGLNPFEAATSPEWDNILSWYSWSPRIGLTYDVFGDGRTAVKFSFNRYTEYLMLQYFSTLHPFYPQSFRFDWYDDNLNKTPDITDRYAVYPTDYRGMDPQFAKNRLDPDCKSPIDDEITVGIQHELFKNFSLGTNFIYKNKQNILESVYYAPDTGEYWYHKDQAAAKKYWVPYTTTVPAQDIFPAQTVTVYIRRNDSPAPFQRFSNVPELSRKYWAFEFVFNKRMADGWQFNGSVVYCKAYGNIGGMYDQSWGWSGLGSTPNLYVNSYGRTNIDRPLQIKLMGTVELPYRIYLSAYYQLMSGSPWERGCSIRPNAAWCTANNAYPDYYFVSLETAGTRRMPTWNTLDLRLEKEFRLGDFGRLSAYIDVINLAGFTQVNMGLIDSYRWAPTAEGANQIGTLTNNTAYKVISSVAGVRTLRFTARFSF